MKKRIAFVCFCIVLASVVSAILTISLDLDMATSGLVGVLLGGCSAGFANIYSTIKWGY